MPFRHTQCRQEGYNKLPEALLGLCLDLFIFGVSLNQEDHEEAFAAAARSGQCPSPAALTSNAKNRKSAQDNCGAPKCSNWQPQRGQ